MNWSLLSRPPKCVHEMRVCERERERGGDLRGRVGRALAVRDRESAREAVSMREREREVVTMEREVVTTLAGTWWCRHHLSVVTTQHSRRVRVLSECLGRELAGSERGREREGEGEGEGGSETRTEAEFPEHVRCADGEA